MQTSAHAPTLRALAERVAALNPDAGVIGAGMLAQLVEHAQRALAEASSSAESDKTVSHVKLELSLQSLHENPPVAIRRGDVESLIKILNGGHALAADKHRDGLPATQGVEQGANPDQDVVGVEQGANPDQDVVGNGRRLSGVADDLVHELAPRGPASDLVGREGDDVIHGEGAPISSAKSNRKSFHTDFPPTFDPLQAALDDMALRHQSEIRRITARAHEFGQVAAALAALIAAGLPITAQSATVMPVGEKPAAGSILVVAQAPASARTPASMEILAGAHLHRRPVRLPTCGEIDYVWRHPGGWLLAINWTATVQAESNTTATQAG